MRILPITAALIALAGLPAFGTYPAPITIVVFNPPSLGSIFPSVVKRQKFDLANGINVTFVERPPDAYAAQFNSGEFAVGGSASVLIVGLGTTRGIKTSYLFNLFNYWGAVVTSRPDLRTLADLKGREVAAAKGKPGDGRATVDPHDRSQHRQGMA
jgi:NitT/TauT family transport system substrate-binding protein